MAAHDFLYPLGHIITGKYWHNLDENSLHLTISVTGWGKVYSNVGDACFDLFTCSIICLSPQATIILTSAALFL